jgi:hypothetical protein
MGVFMLAAGFLLFGNPLLNDATAQQDPCDNGNPNGPCAWPAQKYEGGLTLGTTELDGQRAAVFNKNNMTISNQYPRKSSMGSVPNSKLAGGVDSGPVDVFTVGFDVASVENLFVHKTWKTKKGTRDLPDSNPSSSDYNDVYVYVQTTGSGTLEGPSGTEPGIDCREDNGNGYNPNHCDLTVTVSEISFVNLDFQADIEGIPIIGDIGIDDSRLNGISSSRDNGYWITEPRNDVCSIGGIIDISFTSININGFCLSLLEPTFTNNVPFADRAEINTLTLYNLQVRGHRYEAVPPDPTDPDQNKVLRLGGKNEPNNDFYAEIRWGKGHDRARFVPKSGQIQGSDDPLDQRFAGPAPEFSDSKIDTSRVAGLANNFDCEGNPTGVGYTDCTQPSQNIGPLQPGPYDDIYR